MLTLLLVFLGYSGLGISLWPNVIPPGITIWEAAGPPQSLAVCAGRCAADRPGHPDVHGLGYWVFRGKVRHGEAYH